MSSITQYLRPIVQINEGYVSLIEVQENEDACGSKHKNLNELKKIIEKVNLPGISFLIPFGISSAEVEGFLREVDPSIFSYWDQLGRLFNEKTGDDVFLERKDVKDLIEKMQNGIKVAFSIRNEEFFNKWFSLDSLKSWLELFKAQDHYVIVRSSGNEDGQVANAGGNESISYVKPALPEILETCGLVIASYCSIASLKNRLMAKSNPFADNLQMSLTMMRLVGEPIGGALRSDDIPVSLVLFTNEPLYVGETCPFRIMRISCSYGHGEGVVGNQQIACDNILIIQSKINPHKLFIIYDLQNKKNRLAPVHNLETSKIELTAIENPQELILKRALNKKMLHLLFNFGIAAETHFQGPTDIEGVFDLKNSIFYPVQARPINRKINPPSYIEPKNAKNRAIVNSTNAYKVLVPGSSIIVRKATEILSAQTLIFAEKIFTDEHRFIAVAQNEPLNSHQIVNFSGIGKPCFYFKELEKLEDLRQRIGLSNQALAVCCQEGRMYLIDESIQQAEELVKEGYTTHPASVEHSLKLTKPPLMIQPFQSLPDDVLDLFLAFKAAESNVAALKILKKIESCPFLTKFQKRTESLKNRVDHFGNLATDQGIAALETAQKLQSKIKKTFQELRSVLEASEEEPLELKLFFVKVLQSLLLNQDDEATDLNCFSIMTINRGLAAAKISLNYQQQFAFRVHFGNERLAAEEALVPEVSSAWIKFLESVEGSKHNLEFKEMMQVISRSGIRPIWLALTFYNESIQSSSPNALIKKLIDDCSIEKQKMIVATIKKRDGIQALKKNISFLADPNSFNRYFSDLQKAIHYFEGEFTQQYLVKSSITKLVANQLMTEFVHVYDLSVKELKRSQQWVSEEKAVVFKEMLLPFFSLLKTWAFRLVGEGKFPMGFKWNLTSYLEEIETRLKNNKALVHDLNASQNFIVAAAELGSGTEFDRHLPITLEDLFTLIHQNLLAVISYLNTELIPLHKITLPVFARTVIEKAEGLRRMQLTGMLLTVNNFSRQYNVPLNNHSATLQLTYDKQSQDIEMKMRFLGQARERWGRIEDLTRLFANFEVFQLVRVSGRNEFCLEIILRLDDKTAENALAFFNTCCDYTMAASLNPMLNVLADHISSTLMEKEEALTEKVEEFVRDPKEEIRLIAINLIIISLKNGQHNDKVIEVGLSLVDDSSEMVQEGVLLLLNKLVSFGFQWQNAASLALQLTQSDHSAIQNSSLLFFKLCVLRHSFAYDEAYQAAKYLIASEQPRIRESVCQLLANLAPSERHIEQCIDLIETLTQDEDSGVKRTAYTVLADIKRIDHSELDKCDKELDDLFEDFLSNIRSS